VLLAPVSSSFVDWTLDSQLDCRFHDWTLNSTAAMCWTRKSSASRDKIAGSDEEMWGAGWTGLCVSDV
jgi:hypothetical protein